MAMIETPRFPDEIAAWLVGGRGFNTTVTETYGGKEYRNAAWEMARGVWDVAEALRTIPDGSAYAVKTLMKFFFIARGQLHTFRLKAPYDNADDSMGVLGLTGLAVAATLTYQMYKNYVISPLSYMQIVDKPVSGSITVYDNGVLVPGATYSTTTGIVTFPSQPTVGHTLTWKGSYDIRVRFAGDVPNLGLDQSGALANWHGMKLVEVREE